MIEVLAVFISGLIIGSFLNVCIYRIPRNESIVFPGSHCPECHQKIAYYDNIPVFSYLWLRGRCRHCRRPIPPHYATVELLTATIYAICYINAPSLSLFVIGAVFATLIIPLIFIDYYHFILPDVITYPGMALGLALSPLHPIEHWNDFLTISVYDMLNVHMNSPIVHSLVGSLVGIFLGGGILWVVAEVYFRVRKMEGLGLGDVKMMAMVGAFLGWKLAWLTTFFGSLVGSLYGGFLIITQGKTLQHKLYFGTFLGFGAIVALLYGGMILDHYFRV
ncbi:MAG: prepilin peptidase [Acidobacteria bacterium]|nr:prepilin peptidase [Acidobacteriota bacterium]